MKALLIFLLCALPATGLLAWLDRFDRRGPGLPDEAPLAEQPAVLLGSDLADAHGQTPFPGALRRLDGFELRVVEEGYFKLYLRIERLGRHEGRPRLEEVRVALFGPPKEGKPNLRATLSAPYVGGDPRELLYAPASSPRVVTLEGGVEALDAAGRPLAEAERLSLDLNAKTVFADVPVVLRLPERAAEVRAAGLEAHVSLKTARLKGPVVASAQPVDGTITLRARGGATASEEAEGDGIRVVFEEDAEIEHPSLRATCQRIDAFFARGEGKVSFVRATLSGGVRLELPPGAAGGLETIEMPSLSIEGEERIAFEGPLHAVWRGRLDPRFLRRADGRSPAALALGDRTVRIDAASGSFRLVLTEGGQRLLDEARFADFRAEDVDGAGALKGSSLVYAPRLRRLVLEGAVEARTPAESLRADRVAVEMPEEGAYELRVEGKKEVVTRTEGLGPLAAAGRGELRLTAEGPLELSAKGDDISFRGRDGVVVTTDAGGTLRCDAIRLDLAKDALASLRADGSVVLFEPSRGAELRGDLLKYEGGVASIEGRPASVSTKEGRSVRAATITYREDRTFAAAGGVDLDTPLSDGARWRLSCREAKGALAADGTPSKVDALGDVRANGPDGEEATGDALAYDGGSGLATLAGAPARLRRGPEIALVAPKGLSLRIEKGRAVEGSSLGPATIDYVPAVAADGTGGDFRSWHVELQGPARFEGDRLVVPAGAKLAGSDGKRDVVLADAKRVEILLDVSGKSATVREIRGSNGVRVEGRGRKPAVVTAETLSYGAGTREVRVAGEAQVVAEGWPRELRFRELLFLLTGEGIDLRRASEIEVR